MLVSALPFAIAGGASRDDAGCGHAAGISGESPGQSDQNVSRLLRRGRYMYNVEAEMCPPLVSAGVLTQDHR